MLKAFSICTILVFGLTSALSLQRSPLSEAPLDKQPATQEETVEIQLARAHVSLAKLNLRQAMNANKDMNVYSPVFIEKLKLHVMIDEAQLQQSLKGHQADAHQVCVQEAKASVQLAETDLKRWSGIRSRRPTATNSINVERAETVLRIAKLNLKKTQNLDGAAAITTHLQSQIDQLRHKILEMEMRR